MAKLGSRPVTITGSESSFNPAQNRTQDVPPVSQLRTFGHNLEEPRTPDVMRFSEDFDLEQMQRELAPFIHSAKKLKQVNEGTAPRILEECADGLSRISFYHAKAKAKANLDRAHRKHVEAKVLLEDFPIWAKTQEGKPTEKIREAFLNQNNLVLEAKKREYESDALYEFLCNVKMLFTMSMSSAKAIAYGNRDSYNVGG
jgi:hypothetical protein